MEENFAGARCGRYKSAFHTIVRKSFFCADPPDNNMYIFIYLKFIK